MFTAKYPISTFTILQALYHKVGQHIARGMYNLVKTKPTNSTSALFMGTFISSVEVDNQPIIRIISTASVNQQRYDVTADITLMVLNGWYMVIDLKNNIAPDQAKPSGLVDIYIGMYEGFFYILDTETGDWEFCKNTEATANR